MQNSTPDISPLMQMAPTESGTAGGYNNCWDVYRWDFEKSKACKEENTHNNKVFLNIFIFYFEHFISVVSLLIYTDQPQH